MGSLWLSKMGSFAWGRRSLGDLGNAIWLHTHYSILINVVGTCQGQALEGTAMPSSPWQSQQPRARQCPLTGVPPALQGILVTRSIQPGARQPDQAAAPHQSPVQLANLPASPALLKVPAYAAFPRLNFHRNISTTPQG